MISQVLALQHVLLYKCVYGLDGDKLLYKVTDIMTKHKHKTEHSVFPVGLKGTPEGDFRKNISVSLESSYITRL